MKIVAVLFSMFVIFVVVQANRGQFPPALEWYQDLPYGDTFGHFFFIGFLAFFINMAMAARRTLVLGRPVLMGSLIVSIVVLLEEFSQIFISTRSFSLSDLGADFVGIALAGYWVRRLHRPELRAAPGRWGQESPTLTDDGL